MSRFVLIDQTITDNRGHYLQYARSVLDCAKEQEYQTILITNKRFHPTKEIGHQIRSLFTYTYWESLTDYREPEPEPKQETAIERQPSLEVAPAPVRKGIRSSRLYRRFWKSSLRIWLTRFIGRLLGQNFDRVKKRLKPFETEVTVIEESDEGTYKAWCFRNDLQKVIDLVDIEEDDIIFIPSISEVELRGIVSLLQDVPDRIRAPLHLLFRRNMFLNRREHYDEELDGLQNFRWTLKLSEEFSAAGKLFFYTDTDELTEQYNRLSECFFSTLPIPHTSFSVSADWEEKSQRNIAYLGDARTEKGYLYLPELVSNLSREGTDQVSFFIQSNFNVPGGEPGISEARTQLESLREPGITLVKDALGRDEYASAVESADIMLILYDPKQYYARSSGVFAEAMSAGIPAIIPADTWMSHQVCQGRYQQIKEQIDPTAGSRELIPIELSKNDVRLEFFPNSGETGLAVACRMDWRNSGSSVCVTITELDDTGHQIARDIQFMEQCKEETCYFPLFLQKHTKTVWIDCRGTYGQRVPRFLEVSLLPLRTDSPVLRERICAVCDDFAHASDKIREMLRCYSEQRRSTLEFARMWYAYHNAGTLIQILRTNSKRKRSRRQLMKHTPKVSVLIPVYNKAAYLGTCLESVLNQTIDSLEIICIDDESSDGSMDVLQRYAAEFPCIHIYTQKNAGAGAARNHAIEHCSGEFLMFLDADDYYQRYDSLDLMYHAAQKFQVDVVFGKITPIFIERLPDSYDRVITLQDFQHDLNFTSHMFRRSLIEREGLRFPPLQHYEDPVFCLDVLCEAQRMVCLDVNVYYYRRTNDNTNIKWTSSRICDYITGLEHNLRIAEKYQYRVLYNDLCERIVYLYDYILCDNSLISKEDAAYDRYFAMIHTLDISMMDGQPGYRLKSMIRKAVRRGSMNHKTADE